MMCRNIIVCVTLCALQVKLLAKRKQEFEKKMEDLDAKYKEAEIARLAAYNSYKESAVRIHQR
jgi:hypothetical protein